MRRDGDFEGMDRPEAPGVSTPAQTGAKDSTPSERLCVVAALTGLAVLVIVCFFPLLRYFFSQDDFYLLYRSTRETGEMLGESFGVEPHHFRPLTKTFYFAAAYRIFGLNPFPYHIVSLVLHLCNSLLVYVLLRKLRLSAAPAVCAASLFALNVAFFHIIGWITCIQQLAAMFFLMISIYTAVDTLETRVVEKQIVSVVTYLLALASLEQTFLAPILILMIAVFGLSGRRPTTPTVVRVLWPHFLLLAAYAGMRLFWKGVPAGGTSAFFYGQNILANLTMYAGAMYDFWPQVGNLIPYKRMSPTPSHVVLFVLAVYNILRHRIGHTFFAVSVMLATLLPALFLKSHYFYYHTYIAAFGAVYLLGLALEDLFALPRRRLLKTPVRRMLVSGAVILMVAGLSYHKVRWNERWVTDPKTSRYGSFVLRRAMIAEKTYRCLTEKAGDLTGVLRIHIGRGSPEYGIISSVPRDLFWAYSRGLAFKMFFDGHEVILERGGVPEHFNNLRSEQTRVFFYDNEGNCYTVDDVLGSE
jgi:hypothetical protein